MVPLLEIDGLTVTVPGPDGEPVAAVRDLSLTLAAGEAVGMVGESGAGKSLTALAVGRLLPPGVCHTAGSVRLAGRDLGELSEREMRGLRGDRIGMVFQEPMTALNPSFTIGFQVIEAIRAHRRVPRAEARRRAIALLLRVGLAEAASRLDAYPHQLSGGQRQRVVIALALAGSAAGGGTATDGEPVLLLADEPTSALDVTLQAQILTLLRELRAELGLTLLLITHDLAVVSETCDRVVVLYAGEVVEDAPADELFRRPAHPYTRALLAATPRLDDAATAGAPPILRAIPGLPPAPGALPPGCPFHPRCGEAWSLCRDEVPAVHPAGEGATARCHLWAPDRDAGVPPAGGGGRS